MVNKMITSVNLAPELKEWVEAIAQAEGKSQSKIIAEALNLLKQVKNDEKTVSYKGGKLILQSPDLRMLKELQSYFGLSLENALRMAIIVSHVLVRSGVYSLLDMEKISQAALSRLEPSSQPPEKQTRGRPPK